MPSMVRMSAPFGLDREHGAGLHRLAVEIDGAGAAMAGVAADMRAGDVELVAQEVDEQGSRLDQRFDGLAVDLHGDLGFSHGVASPGQPRARALARASARASMTPAILVRYCAGPRASVAGAVIASAAATAFFTVAASSVEPIRIFAASSAQSGVSATLVSPIEHAGDFAAAHGEHDGGGGGGIIADLAFEFLVGVAVSGGRHRNAHGGEDVAAFQRGEIGALIETLAPRCGARRPCPTT